MLSSAFRRLGGRGWTRWNSTLVVASHNNSKLGSDTLNTVSAAMQLGKPVSLLVAGGGDALKDVAASASKVKGIDKVYVAQHDALEHFLPENMASFLHTFQKSHSFTNILASCNEIGKNVMPRFAALIDVSMLSDVIQIKDETTFVRPTYAGNALATIKTSDAVRVMTIRSTAFEDASVDSEGVSVEEVDTSSVKDAGMSSWIKDELKKSDRPELASARVVISGGRALKSAENFEILYKLADALNGAVGASRAAVDAGYVSNDMQVGQTGKVVAPELYIAVGISGAIQHVAGMKDSKVIVSINKDPDSPIFQISDYSLTGDLFQAVPELTKLIEENK